MARTYLVIQASDVSSVDFAAVCETSAETLRYSVDNTKTFIKWEGDQPAFVTSLAGTEGPYTNKEIRAILATDVWTDPDAEF